MLYSYISNISKFSNRYKSYTVYNQMNIHKTYYKIMAKLTFSLCYLGFFFYFIMCSSYVHVRYLEKLYHLYIYRFQRLHQIVDLSGSLIVMIIGQGKTWCLAQPEASEPQLQQVLDYLCGRIDCGEIQPGASCFDPDTVRKHASYAINMNYRTNGECDGSYAFFFLTDPCKLLCHHNFFYVHQTI